MSFSSNERQERERVIKVSSDANRSLLSPTKITRNSLRSKECASNSSNPLLSPSLSLRRSFKEKDNFETQNKLSPEEKTVWKSSKLFSKTLSSIDGLRSSKKGNSNSMNAEYGTSDINNSNIDTNIESGNRSTNAISSSIPEPKTSEWKLLKNKLSILRKKGNKEVKEVCNNSSVTVKDIKALNTSTNADYSIGKHEKSPQGSAQRSISPSESILAKKASPQEKGIVCKKEDLMHIISEASKGVKVTKLTKTKLNKSDEYERHKVSPTTSINGSVKKNSLKKQHSCGSQSSDRDEKSTAKHSSNPKIYRSNSCEGENRNKNQYHIHETQENDSKTKLNKTLESEGKCTQNESDVTLCKQNKIITEEKITITETNCAYIENDNKVYNQDIEGHNDEIHKEEVSAAVQWDDDINYVDPMLLGDAIQTFLRGLGSSGVTNASNEKRVSFKKSF